MKTTYSLLRIKQLETILLKLKYRKSDKKYLTKKELKLQNKLFTCIISQKNRLPITVKLNNKE